MVSSRAMMAGLILEEHEKEFLSSPLPFLPRCSEIAPDAQTKVRERTHELYSCDDINIEEGAEVDAADDGCWVHAWLWVGRDEMESETSDTTGVE